MASIGLLGKIKIKVGLNKKKDPKVIDNDNGSDISNGKVHSNAKSSIGNEMSNSSGNNSASVINNNAKTSTSNDNNNVSDISNSTKTSISDNVSSQNLSESDYIGQGVLAGRENNSEMELDVESQKRSHPDSDSVDSVDDSSFATPVAPPLAPPKRSQLLLSPRAVLGPLLLTVTAAAVGPQNARLRSIAPPLGWHPCSATFYWLCAEASQEL